MPADDLVAAVDVGGTRIKSALVHRDYSEAVALTGPTPAGLDGPGCLADAVADTVAELRAAAEGDVGLVACGVVVPGLVDEQRGLAVFSANLGWRDLDLLPALAARLDVPVALGHDVRAGLVAEARLGAARGARHAVFVALGTGIAGALMVDGRVLVADGWAGELGHVVVEPNGPACRCGGAGCLEAVSSAAAIELAYAQRTGTSSAVGRVPADEIARRVRAGEPDALAVWERAVEALARALVATVTLTGVDRVIVGGGLAGSGDLLLDPLRDHLDRHLTFQRRPHLEAAVLGDRAGCLGAACLAWDIA